MTPGLSSVPDRIQWHEGMLLGPQHFQQFQARVDALGAWQQLAAQPLAWGIRRFEIDTGLLAAGRLRVLVLEAVMPDGTAVSYDAADPLDNIPDHGLELDLAAHAGALEGGPLPLHLTLPWARSMRQPGAQARFRSVQAPLVSDEVSDSEDIDLPRLRPRLALAGGATPSSLWQTLFLGTVVRQDGHTRLGDELPPLMLVNRERPLWQRAWALCAQLRGKAAYLARQGQLSSSRTDDRLALLEHKARLGALLAPLTQMEAVLQTRPLHPYAMYLALCQALGPLASLRPGAMPPLPPAYDHAAPGAVFDSLLGAVEAMLADVSQEHRVHAFTLQGEVFSLPLQPQWLGGPMVIGLRGQPERELCAWLDGAMIGSAPVWASLRDRRVLGAPRSRLEEVPELGLRAGCGYTLFRIDTPAALVTPGDTLQIANMNEGHVAQRPHEAVLFVKG